MTTRAAVPSSRITVFLVAALALPMLGFALLLAQPGLDITWEHHPSHFWLVLTAGGLNAVLAYATATAAARRGDARVLLVSLAFLSSAGFLGLHALATPGVLLDTSNAGFVIATPVGLLLASAFAAASALDLSGDRGRAVMRHQALLRNGVLAVMLGFAVWSLTSLTDRPDPPERASGPLLVLAIPAMLLFLYAVVAYVRLYRERRAEMLLGMAAGFALLAEAMFAVVFARNWHATWWEWHLLMLFAFILIASSAQRQWHQERFSPLYLDDTAAGRRELSIVFADLEGFTSFSETHEPTEVSAMLNEYFERVIPPVVQEHGGEIDNIIGDALMVVFNRRGDQPDHAERAARAALALQEHTVAVAAAHPGWPRFRAGVNTGTSLVGVLGAAGGRTHTAIGDAVNVASRLEGRAPVGGVVIGGETARRLRGARLEPLGALDVKGRDQPVDTFLLVSLGAADGEGEGTA